MIHEPNWAFSSLGTPIALHADRSLAQLKNQRPILLMGGVHGDEPEGVWLARKTLALLMEDRRRSSPVFRVPWIVIPCLNVDGFAKGTRVNGRGVDLNRNYPAKNWSPAFESERYHPGAAAGSEAEIQAVVGLINDLRPRIMIHCHSWEPCVVFTGQPGARDAERLAESSGYKAVAEIGYPTPGALSQYGWADLQIPVICIEERSGTAEPEVWPHFEKGMREIFADDSPRA